MRLFFERWIVVMSVVSCLGLLACTKAQPEETPVQGEVLPTDPIEFRRYLIEKYPEEMAATMCQCCNTTLRQCYDDTLDPGVKGCPED